MAPAGMTIMTSRQIKERMWGALSSTVGAFRDGLFNSARAA
jgi:hypothetical protein